MENLEIRKDVKRTGTRKKCNLGRIGKTLEIHGNPWKSMEIQKRTSEKNGNQKSTWYGTVRGEA